MAGAGRVLTTRSFGFAMAVKSTALHAFRAGKPKILSIRFTGAEVNSGSKIHGLFSERHSEDLIRARIVRVRFFFNGCAGVLGMSAKLSYEDVRRLARIWFAQARENSEPDEAEIAAWTTEQRESNSYPGAALSNFDSSDGDGD